MRPVATCPYCGGDHFTAEALRADAPNPNVPNRFFEAYGHWFNKCEGCGDWSIHRDGKNFSIPKKSKRPTPFSEPAIE